MTVAEFSRSQVRAVLDAARSGRHLQFAFQPVVSAETGETEYYECLLRLRSDDGQAIDTGGFVGNVERSGLVGAVDRIVLSKAVGELASHAGVCLGLNISGLTAGDTEWLATFLREAPDRSVMQRIVVEITETAALA